MEADGRMDAVEFVPRVPVPERGSVPKNRPTSSEKLELCGWLLFVVSAFFFTFASLRAGDVVGLLGGLFFLLACGVFLAAFGRRGGKN